MLKTETPSTQHPQLDLYPVADLVAALVDDQVRYAYGHCRELISW